VRNVVAWAIKPVKQGGLGARAIVVNVSQDPGFYLFLIIQFRGCAGTPVTSPQLYSAGTTVDLAHALHYLRYTYPESPLHGIGFSLGASVLARYLGESSSKSLLSSGMVLGCPWDLTTMTQKLETEFVARTVYSRAMALNLLRMFLGHHDRDHTIFEREDSNARPYLGEMRKLQKKWGVTLKQVDNVMVSKIGGPPGEDMWPFKGADEYYAWACPKHFITSVDR
jgi:predicted alpha/beta-fold hydrolase